MVPGTFTGERVALAGDRTAAVDVSGGSATLTDVSVAAAPSPAGHEGQGMRVTSGGRLGVERGTVDGARGLGVGVLDSTASATWTDLAVRDLAPLACTVDGTCTDAWATALYAAGDTTASRVMLTGGAGVGIQVYGATATVTDVVVSGQEVGTNVPTGTLAAERLELSDNTTDTSTESLPRPTL